MNPNFILAKNGEQIKNQNIHTGICDKIKQFGLILAGMGKVLRYSVYNVYIVNLRHSTTPYQILYQ